MPSAAQAASQPAVAPAKTQAITQAITPAKLQPKTQAQKALDKLGLVRDVELALHLPLRYEDETRITMLADARDGDMVQIEGTVTNCEVTFRPRRQLRVTVDDGTDTCTLRFLNFYPSHQKRCRSAQEFAHAASCVVALSLVVSAVKWCTLRSSWQVVSCPVR